MYTLENGRKVEDLTIEEEEGTRWAYSDWFWWCGQLVRIAMDREAKEEKMIDKWGNEILTY